MKRRPFSASNSTNRTLNWTSTWTTWSISRSRCVCVCAATRHFHRYECNLFLAFFAVCMWQKHHAELAAAIEEKYVDFVTLTAETETWKKKSFDGQFHRKHGGKIYIRLFDGTDKVNPNCTYTLECRSNRFTFQVTKRCLKICAHAKLIPLLLYNPRFHEREKLEPLKDKKPFTWVIVTPSPESLFCNSRIYCLQRNPGPKSEQRAKIGCDKHNATTQLSIAIRAVWTAGYRKNSHTGCGHRRNCQNHRSVCARMRHLEFGMRRNRRTPARCT